MAKTNDVCLAMRQARISDAESKAGTYFCLHCCPYEVCLIGNKAEPSRIIQEAVVILDARGLDNKEIATVLNISARTVQRRLRQTRIISPSIKLPSARKIAGESLR